MHSHKLEKVSQNEQTFCCILMLYIQELANYDPQAYLTSHLFWLKKMFIVTQAGSSYCLAYRL